MESVDRDEWTGAGLPPAFPGAGAPGLSQTLTFRRQLDALGRQPVPEGER